MPNRLAQVMEHEMGHIFYALDQYYTSPYGSCTETSPGVLIVENQNARQSPGEMCLINVSSIMRMDFYDPNLLYLDYYGAGQIGWRDLNNNNIADSVDISYNTFDYDNDADGLIDYWDPRAPDIFANANHFSAIWNDSLINTTITAIANDNSIIKEIDLYIDGVLEANFTAETLSSMYFAPSNVTTSVLKTYDTYTAPYTHSYYATVLDIDGNLVRDPPAGSKYFNHTEVCLYGSPCWPPRNGYR